MPSEHALKDFFRVRNYGESSGFPREAFPLASLALEKFWPATEPTSKSSATERKGEIRYDLGLAKRRDRDMAKASPTTTAIPLLNVRFT